MSAPASDVARPVRIEQVSAAYGEVQVLHDVDLDIESARIVSLLGPSGCGKTTLLRCIAGLERPTTGAITIGTTVVSGVDASGQRRWVRPEKRGVGMVFQDGALFPHLDVAGNVGFGLEKRDRRGPRVDEMLEMVGLAGYGERMPHELSGGQQQRVALARALAPAPRVLLLDEPFSSLDVALRVSLRVEVRALLRDVGVTAVFVTHDQDEAFVMGDEVAVLREGAIEQVGTPAQLYVSPATPWVATFVGDANIVSGTASGGSATTIVGPVSVPGELVGAVDVLVRPEELELFQADDAVVESVEYFGHDTRYIVTMGSESIAVRETGEPALDVGDRVGVRHTGATAMAWTPATV